MRQFFRAFLCSTLLLLAACTEVYTWNQKLTVYVNTPDGELSASSITEVTITHSDGKFVFPEARGARFDFRGEAIALEITPGNYLFVLLNNTDNLPHKAFPQFINRSGRLGEWAGSIQEHREVGLVPNSDYPMMVTFIDIDDPMSVQLVNSENFQETFGVGFSLSKMTLEIVEEDASFGRVDRILPWLTEIWPATLDGQRIRTADALNQVANSLSANSFSTEISNVEITRVD